MAADANMSVGSAAVSLLNRLAVRSGFGFNKEDCTMAETKKRATVRYLVRRPGAITSTVWLDEKLVFSKAWRGWDVQCSVTDATDIDELVLTAKAKGALAIIMLRVSRVRAAVEMAWSESSSAAAELADKRMGKKQKDKLKKASTEGAFTGGEMKFDFGDLSGAVVLRGEESEAVYKLADANRFCWEDLEKRVKTVDYIRDCDRAPLLLLVAAIRDDSTLPLHTMSIQNSKPKNLGLAGLAYELCVCGLTVLDLNERLAFFKKKNGSIKYESKAEDDGHVFAVTAGGLKWKLSVEFYWK